VFDIFTDAAKRALVLAQDEAIMLGHDFVAAEHLLLGLVGPDDGLADGLAGQVLAGQGGWLRPIESAAGMHLTALLSLGRHLPA